MWIVSIGPDLHRVSKLKPRASEKMGDLITNNEERFFSSPILSVENRTSDDVLYIFFLLYTLPIFSVKTEYLKT